MFHLKLLRHGNPAYGNCGRQEGFVSNIKTLVGREVLSVKTLVDGEAFQFVKTLNRSKTPFSRFPLLDVRSPV